MSFKDFKTTSHFTNINYFASDTERAIVKGFSGRLAALAEACRQTGGVPHEAGMPYDLSVRFEALPRVSLLLLFNDRDDEFPAGCKVLFNRARRILSGSGIPRDDRQFSGQTAQPRG